MVRLVRTVDDPIDENFIECVDLILISPCDAQLNMPYTINMELAQDFEYAEFYDKFIETAGWLLELWGDPLSFTLTDSEEKTKIRLTVELVED